MRNVLLSFMHNYVSFVRVSNFCLAMADICVYIYILLFFSILQFFVRLIVHICFPQHLLITFNCIFAYIYPSFAVSSHVAYLSHYFAFKSFKYYAFTLVLLITFRLIFRLFCCFPRFLSSIFMAPLYIFPVFCCY